MTTIKRFHTLDGLRGIAAIAVMLHHITGHLSSQASLFANAPSAVDLFFCLSGFVIAFSYLDRLSTQMPVSEFLLRRLIRLYPMFIIGLALGGIALIGKVVTRETSLTGHDAVKAILLNIFYLPYLSHFYIQLGRDRIPSAIFPTDDPAWSLFFEFAANIAFAFLMLKPRKNLIFLLVAIGLAGLLVYEKMTWIDAPGWGNNNFIGGIPRTVFGFFSGVLLFMVYDTYRNKIPSVNPLVICGLLLFILSLPDFKQHEEFVWLGITVLLVPVIVAFSSISCSRSPLVNQVFDYLGWLSYPIYCLHYPIFSIITIIVGDANYGITDMVLCMLVTLVISHVIASLVDEPIRAKLAAKLRH